MLATIDIDDAQKARKSLIFVAFATLVFSNLEIVSDTFAILGFEFRVSQVKMVALGQIATALLTVVFIFRFLPVFVQKTQEARVRFLEKKHKTQMLDLEFSWMGPRREYDNSPMGEINELADTQEFILNRTIQRYDDTVFILSTLAIALVDFGFPVLIGVITLLAPQNFSDLVSYLAK